MTTSLASIIIGILSLGLVILGWLINKIWADSRANNNRMFIQIDKLDGSTSKLGDSISGLNGILLSQGEKINSADKACELKHGGVVERLHTHEKRLNKHSDEIDGIKQKIK